MCRDSFYDFLQRMWPVFIPEEPVWNWHIEYLCAELQSLAEKVLAREPKDHDLIINISPGTTKSTVCSVAFPVWMWTRDPTIRTICGSYAAHLSLYLGTLSRRIATSERFRTLFPDVVLDEEQKGLLTTSAGGQRISTSTGGAITGFHGHVLIIDDPINPRGAVSKAFLTATNEWIDDTLMTRKIDRRTTPLILIMQRLAEDDPTGHLLEKARQPHASPVRHICLPAYLTPGVRPHSAREYYIPVSPPEDSLSSRAPGEEIIETPEDVVTQDPTQDDEEPDEVVGLMDPIRLSMQCIEGARAELGDWVFSAQYLQHPVPRGGGMFKVDRIVLEDDVRGKGTMRLVRYWDKAGTHEAGAYTVGVLMGKGASGEYWVLDVVRGQWEAAQRERLIRQAAEADGVNVTVGVEQEPGSGGKESAQATIRSLAGFTAYRDRPTGDKAQRADPYATQVNDGNVHVLKRAWTQDYIGELRFFPRSRYKDQVDASSGAFARLTLGGFVAGGLGGSTRARVGAGGRKNV